MNNSDSLLKDYGAGYSALIANDVVEQLLFGIGLAGFSDVEISTDVMDFWVKIIVKSEGSEMDWTVDTTQFSIPELLSSVITWMREK